MIATMNMHGVIELSPETEIEAFALKRWSEISAVPQDDPMRMETFKWRSSSLVIHLAVKDKMP